MISYRKSIKVCIVTFLLFHWDRRNDRVHTVTLKNKVLTKLESEFFVFRQKGRSHYDDNNT